MSEPFFDPTDPDRRPKPLDYATRERRRSGLDWLGTGCLIVLITLILVGGVLLGTCALMR